MLNENIIRIVHLIFNATVLYHVGSLECFRYEMFINLNKIL